MVNVSRYQWEILSHLQDGKHQTIDEIYKYLKKHYLFLTKWGIHKALQKLADNGLVQKHYHLWDMIIWEKIKWPHAHIYCEDVKHIIDVQAVPVDITMLKLPKWFSVNSVNVTITGTFRDSDCTIAYNK